MSTSDKKPKRLRILSPFSAGNAPAPEPTKTEVHLEPHSPELLKGLYSPAGQRRYCTYPFRLFGLASDILKPCTWLRQIDHVSVVPIEAGARQSLHDVWHSEPFNNVRRSVVEGEHLYCDLGNCPEYMGEQKYFLTIEEIEKEFPAIGRYINDGANVYEEGPRVVNVAYDTGCNLTCHSCNRLELPKLDRETVEEFGHALSLLGPDIRYIYFVGMGDPFGTPHYLKWLQTVDISRFAKLECMILNTNAIGWTEANWESIPQKTRAMIRTAVISMDGASAASFEANRYPAKFDDMMARLQYISGIRRAGNLDCLRAYFVYQVNNFRELPRMVEIAREFGFDELFFARIRNWRGWSEEYLASLDVTKASHPDNAEFLTIAEQVRAMTDGKLAITVMR